MSDRDLKTLDDELNTMILNGQILQAFDAFYAEDVVMQENNSEPTRGKAANRKREEVFVASIEEFHGAKVLGNAAGEGVTYAEWFMDVTLTGMGRIQYHQVAARRWNEGQVVEERFYFNAG